MAKNRIKRISRLVALQQNLKKITTHRLMQARLWQDELELKQKDLIEFLDTPGGADRLAEIAEHSLQRTSVDRDSAKRDQQQHKAQLTQEMMRLRHVENLLQDSNKQEFNSRARQDLQAVIEGASRKNRSASDKTDTVE